MTRAKLASEMRAKLKCSNDTDLMNQLQGRGLVSDNAVTLDDVSDGDLIRARNAVFSV